MKGKRYRLYRIMYFVIMVLWICQIIFGGFNEYLLIPTACLIICYCLMKGRQVSDDGRMKSILIKQ